MIKHNELERIIQENNRKIEEQQRRMVINEHFIECFLNYF